ncbi:YbaY family lipoprotein [Chloroflexota bacterium]
MRKLGLIIFIILAIILIAGCANTATVTGTVTYRERIALLTQGVVVTIKVEDISRADAPAVTIGEQIIENPSHQVPIPFEIEYNPDDINERYTYAMRVRIEVDGELWFTNTSRYQVITRGNPTSNIEVVLEKVGPQETLTLEDTTWVLESYGEKGNLQAVLEGTEITIEFKSAEGKFGGSGGCNNYFGGYEINKNELTIKPPIGATAMACPETIMDQEQEYFKLLEITETFRIQNVKLIINCSGNNGLFFIKK